MRVLQSKCSRCLQCSAVCMFDAVTVRDGEVNIDEAVCFGCGVCRDSCPVEAIVDGLDELDELDEPNGQGVTEQAGGRGEESEFICLYLEFSGGRLSSSSLQVIGAARRLQVQSGLLLAAFLIGEHAREAAAETARYGVGEVWFVEQPGIGRYAEDVRVQLVAEWAGLMKPAIILAGGLRHERSIMARVAARLQTGLCADCIDIAIGTGDGTLVATRTAFGGTLMASIHMPDHRPQMATLKEGAFDPAEQAEGFYGRLTDGADRLSIPASVYEVLEIRKIGRWLSDFEDAEIIVAVGRGLGQAGNLPLALALAEALDAKIGATRAVVEAGWLDASHQIGQSGKVVRPRVYIACGISGALQHTVGMDRSGTVIAINTDRSAPIFQYAAYGLVGDMQKIIPMITELVKDKRMTLRTP